MENDSLKINVQSEIGKLDAVLLHRPGAEVENMTPMNVQRALYSDILNLSIAQSEYEQMSGVLSKVAKVHEVRSLLVKVLDQPGPREDLIRRICETEDVMSYMDQLLDMKSAELASVLIEGLPARINTLTSSPLSTSSTAPAFLIRRSACSRSATLTSTRTPFARSQDLLLIKQ